jgi:1-acyl-sn-glycerol-3-phosphate acyltransferase
MRVGWRNRVIVWGQGSIPFSPAKSDLIETTKKAMGVLANGYVLGIAGEGRLSDREGAIVPLQDGAAFLALRGRVPIVPVAIIGTRWLRFRKRVRLQVGPPIELGDRRANREGVESVLAELTAAYERLLEGVVEEPPPGPLGRFLTDLFNDRPWLTDPNWDHPPPRGDAHPR